MLFCSDHVLSQPRFCKQKMVNRLYFSLGTEYYRCHSHSCTMKLKCTVWHN